MAKIRVLQQSKNVVLELIKNRLPGKELYQEMLYQLANTGDTNWVLVSMDGDNFGAIKRESEMYADYIVSSFNSQVKNICDKYKSICKGYKRGGDEISLFIYCKNKTQENNEARKIMKELFNNIRKNGQFTVSAGLSWLEEDEIGAIWENRAEIALQDAKKNGKNRIHWYNEN